MRSNLTASDDEARVFVVHAVGAVLRHQNRLGAHFRRPERGGGVGGEEGVARAAGQNDDAPFFQVAQGAAVDVRLGDALDRNGGLDAGVDALLLQGVLQREGVDDGSEHPDMVGGDALHAGFFGELAAHDVAAADDDSRLDAAALQGGDFARDFGDGLIVNDPVAAVSGEGFAGEFEQHAGPLHGGRRVVRHGLGRLADLEPDKPLDLGLALDELCDGLLRFANIRLFQQDGFLVERADAAFDDLL